MTIVRDLSARSVAAWPTVDLAHVSEKPASPIEPFEFHGCDCAAASFKGSPPWELHTTGDELLYILAGSTSLTVRGPEGETQRNLRAGDLVVVPRGCWHRNDAPEGVTPEGADAGSLRAAWSWLKQTDLIPDKGQFRSRFYHPLSYFSEILDRVP